jgi:hypothetical protein
MSLTGPFYAPSREHDMHVARAFDLLKDSAVKAEIETRGPKGSLDEALESWRKLKADHRLPKLKQFRDKYTAQLVSRILKCRSQSSENSFHLPAKQPCCLIAWPRQPAAGPKDWIPGTTKCGNLLKRSGRPGQ